jgi:preprotein translocase subunit Sec61beta
VAEYFTRLAGAAGSGTVGLDADDLAELRAHVEERVARGDDVAAVLAELGDPEALTRAFADEDAPPDPDGPEGRATSRLSGRLLGVPFDLRPPTARRYTARLWDPTDPRVLVPTVLGIGWTVNFGALAVRAGLVRPDDEDSPFAMAPEAVVRATLAAPALVTAATVVLVATRWHRLPARVPTSWSATGKVRAWGPRIVPLGLSTAGAVGPLAAAASVHLRGRPPQDRVVASAGALAMACLGFGTLSQTVAACEGRGTNARMRATLAVVVTLPLLLLVAVSRAGRRVEQRRDLRKDT